MINVGVIYSSNLFRNILTAELGQYQDIEILYQIEHSDDLKWVTTKPVEIILLELSNRNLDGLETLKILRNKKQNTKILIISGGETKDLLVKIFLARANGYISKDATSEEIYYALKSCNASGFYHNYHIHELFIETLLELNDLKLHNGRSQFSLEELNIIRLIYEGKKSKEIGNIICKSKSSIDKIRSRLNSKTGSNNSVELIKYVLNNKIIDA